MRRRSAGRLWFAVFLGFSCAACTAPETDDASDNGPFAEGPGNSVDAPDDDPSLVGDPMDDPNTPRASTCKPSSLYGKSGELWSATGRLIDHGYAGYHTGKDPIPTVAGPIKSVIDFGAKPNDTGDDTAAFLTAIAQTPSGVLLVPAGRYIITKRLEITKSNFVLRGAGTGKSILYFPKSLGDVYGLTFNAAGASNWSFGGAFLAARGSDGGARLSTISANAARGATTIDLASAPATQVGDWVRVVQTDANGSMLSAFYDGTDPGDVAEDGNQQLFHVYSKVTAVQGKRVTLERPLPFQVDTRWAPELRAVKPSVREVGIEDLTLEFLGTTYPGHFKEHGYNGIQYSGVSDSWVRNVEILNSDLGVSINGSVFTTVTDVVLDTNFNRGSNVGHHGLNSSSGNDVLFTRFDVRKKYVHDLTVDYYAFATVFADGKGGDLNMDHHGRSPVGTLWTKLDLGAGTRAFASGGNANRMPHTGEYSTYWNITGKAMITPPANDFGPLLTFVGVRANDPKSPPASWLVEKLLPTELCQPDLHAAMLARRP
jgi:hypothetical protein